MKIHRLEQRSSDWKEIRRGKVTGTGLKRIVGSKTVKDSYFYELLSERVSVDDGNEESALDRGERLESEAITEFEKKTGKIVDLIGFLEADENEFIGCSPDGLIENNGVFDEAIEVKCLSSANHVKAWLSNTVPDEFFPQVIQYFIVNPDLKTLYFTLYDPRVTVHPLHIIEVNKANIEKEIEEYRTKELEFIAEVNSKINDLISI